MGDGVWLLWFEGKAGHDAGEDLLIGVYRSEEAAEDAIERLRNKPGFRDNLAAFHAYPRTADQDWWTDGFVSV